MKYKDFLDLLLPNTKVRFFRELYHFLGTVPDKDGEVFVFKRWDRYHKRWRYHALPDWELEGDFEDGVIHIVPVKS